MKNEEIYRKALRTYGSYSQIVVAIEEMSEAQKELCKAFRNGLAPNKDRLAEEIADVYIMLEQMELLFGLEDVALWKAAKIDRLKKSLEEEL